MPAAGGKLGLVKECAALLRGGSGEGNTAAILQTLDRLKEVRVTPNVLRKTEVGKLINSKALLHHADLDVRQRSSALVASWRAIVKEATATGTGLGVKRAPGEGGGAAGSGLGAGSATPPGAAVGGEPPSRRRRLGLAAPPSRASSIGGAGGAGAAAAAAAAASPAPAAPAAAGGSAAAAPGAPPIPYETTGAIKHAAPSGPTPGPVPRGGPTPANMTNRYAPEGAGATVNAVQSRASGMIKDEDEKDPSLAAGSSGYSFGAPSGGPPMGCALDGDGPPAKPGKNPRVSLVSIFNECVPYPSERPGSGGRRGGKGYFCYENFHTGSCSRGDTCPFPHVGGEGNE